MANFPLFIAISHDAQPVKCFLHSILSHILKRLVITNWLTFWLSNRVIRFLIVQAISPIKEKEPRQLNYKLTICSFFHRNPQCNRLNVELVEFAAQETCSITAIDTFPFVSAHIWLKHVLKSFNSNPCLLFYTRSTLFALWIKLKWNPHGRKNAHIENPV